MEKASFFRLILIVILSLSSAGQIKSQMVYKTPSGHKYHLATCRMVKNVSEKVSIADAHNQGLTACLICKPATLSGRQGVKSVQGETSTFQCNGQTKAGTRCRHKTSIGNGFCYQHQPR